MYAFEGIGVVCLKSLGALANHDGDNNEEATKKKY